MTLSATTPSTSSTDPAHAALALEVADRIGARLCRDAIWHGDRCTWVGPSMEHHDGHWQVVHRSLGPDLYAGTAGIARFLLELHALTGEGPVGVTARAALRQAVGAVDQVPDETWPGFYSGALGIAHTAVLAAERLGEESWLGAAARIRDELTTRGPAETGIDLIMGSAGAIPPLLDLHRRTGDDAWRALAARHTERLVALATPQETGVSWDTLPGMAPRPLTGYAHGSAGVALALLEWGWAAADARAIELGTDGLRWEQSHFSEAHGNWPDFRDHSEQGHVGDEPVYAMAWCHGAPGIGLARLRASVLLGGDPALRAQAETAVRTTQRYVEQAMTAPGFDCSYCHGLTGNAELLAAWTRHQDDPACRAVVDGVASFGWSSYEEHGRDWPCGVTNGGPSPSLFLGMAGIGHWYLRLARPDRVASVLLVEP